MPTTYWNDPTILGAAYGAPQVATLANGNFVMVWTQGTDSATRNVVFQVFDPTGQAVGDITLAEGTASPTYAPTVYATSDGFAIVATRDYLTTGDDDVRLFRFGNDGVFQSETLVANSGNDETGGTGSYNYGFSTAYISNDEVQLVTYTPDLVTRTETTIVMAGSESGLAVATVGNSTVLAWQNSGSGLVMQLADNQGVLYGAPVIVAAPSAFISYGDVDITALRSGYAVSYSASNVLGSSGPSYYIQLYSNGGVAAGAPIWVTSGREGSLLDVEVMRSENGFLVVYTTGYGGFFGVSNREISGQFFEASGRAVGSEFYIATGGGQSEPDVSLLADGRIVVTYSDNGQAAFQIMDPRDGLVNGTANQDHLYGSDLENDQIVAANGDDFLYGLAGNDRLDGGKGADRMEGGRGDDIYIVGDAADLVIEAANSGYDIVRSSVTFSAAAATAVGVEEITLTGALAVNATGNALANTITGNGAANLINGGKGADQMAGGGGGDTYTVDNVGDVVIEQNVAGIDTVNSSVTFTLGANIETLTLTGSAAINGTGNTGANTLTGNAGANVLNGGADADTMSGLNGNDVYYVDNAGDTVIEASATGGTDLVNSAISYILGANVENLTLTGSAAIDGTGNTLANAITGNAGANILNGGTGADAMSGLKGNDTYYIDNVGDTVVETSASGGTDLVSSSVSFVLGANVENLTLTGSAAINGTGNTLANAITGNAGANILNGGTGADAMSGMKGNDTYYVDNVGDTVVETSASGGTDLVSSSVSFVLGAKVENLTLTGSAAINGTGNTLANAITGNSGINIITGGAGADVLTGGAGADRFVYAATADSTVTVFDRIADLTAGDKIDLSAIDANTVAAGNQAFAIVNAFTDVAGQMTLKYAAGTNLTTILMDVNGDGVADMKITVTGDQHAFTNFVF